MNTPQKSSKYRTWCGPYALSVVTGVEYDRMFEYCKKVSKRKRLQGMYLAEMTKVAKKCGLKHFEWEKTGAMTLKHCFDYLIPNRIYIINVTRHFLVVDTSNWLVIDNQTAKWHTIEECRYKQARVRMTAEVLRVKEEKNFEEHH